MHMKAYARIIRLLPIPQPLPAFQQPTSPEGQRKFLVGTPQRDDLINWLKMITAEQGRESLELVEKIALPAGADAMLTQLFTSGASNEL